MANRLTKGKALVGSLDVQGELTINGEPVGAGGSSGTPIAYSMYFDPTDTMQMNNERWSTGMGPWYIKNVPNNMYAAQNFLINNNIQPWERYDVTDVEYMKSTYDMNTMTQTFAWAPASESGEFAGYNFYAVSVLDYMSFQPQINVAVYGNATYSMNGGTFRFNLRKKG